MRSLRWNRSSQIHHPTSIEKQELVEEKDTEKEKEAGQEPEIDFKKAKGAKTGENTRIEILFIFIIHWQTLVRFQYEFVVFSYASRNR